MSEGLFDDSEFAVCPRCGGSGRVFDGRLGIERMCECQAPEATLPDPARPLVGRFHHDGQDTEKIAAERVAPRSGTQRAGVLDELRRAGSTGRTDYELWRSGIGARPHVAGTRREELIADGWPIRDSRVRRRTDTGSPAIVWVLEEEQ